MKKLAFVALTALSSSALAFEWKPEYYAGGGFATWQYSNTLINNNVAINSLRDPTNYSIQSLEGFAGVQLIKYLKVEARAGFGMNTGREQVAFINDGGTPDDLTDDAVTLNSIEVEMDYYASIYVRPEVKNEKASLYGLFGVTTMDTTLILNDVEGSETSTGASYGIGAGFVVNEQFDVNIEWKKLINDEDFDMRGGSISFNYNF